MKLIIILFLLFCSFLNANEIYLWHSFRGKEKLALEYIEKIYNLKNETTGQKVKLFDIDADTFLYQIEHNTNIDTYPDLFIWAHDKIGLWIEKDLVIPIDNQIDFQFLANFITTSVNALRYSETDYKLYGLPLSIECLTLFYNKKYLQSPPKTFNEFLEYAINFTDAEKEKFGLVYQIDNFYYHSIWLHSFNGRIFDVNNNFIMTGAPIENSLKLTYDFLNKYKIVPQVPEGLSWWDYKLKLFNNNQALFLISGPWVIGSLSNEIDWGITVLPDFSETTSIMPFLGVKAIFVSSKNRTDEKLNQIIDVLKFFTSEQAAVIMGNIGGYIPANINAYKDDLLNSDNVKVVIRDQAMRAVPMPNNKEMEKIWNIMNNRSAQPEDWGLLKNVQEGIIPLENITKLTTEFSKNKKE